MNTQRGSALIYIFVAIALFAALTLAVSRSNRGGDTGSAEKTSILVSDYLTMANSMATTIKMLKAQGCKDTDFNFTPDGANNTTSPTDKSCNVFDAAGGGMRPDKSPPNWFSNTTSFNGNWYHGGYCIRGVGTGVSGTCLPENAELLLLTSNVTKEMCIGVNKTVNFNPPSYEPPDFPVYMANFVGTYGNAIPPEITIPEFTGKKIGCIKQTGPIITGSYWIFNTMLAR